MITGGDAAYSVLEGCHKSLTDSLLFSKRRELLLFYSSLSIVRIYYPDFGFFCFFCFFRGIVGGDFYEDRVE